MNPKLSNFNLVEDGNSTNEITVDNVSKCFNCYDNCNCFLGCFKVEPKPPQ